MEAKRVQAASILLSGLLILMALANIPLFQSNVVGISALVSGYIAALIAVGITCGFAITTNIAVSFRIGVAFLARSPYF